MKDDLCEALTLIKEYCENYTCYACMFYKSKTGCFFKYHDIPAPHKWKPDEIYDADDEDDEWY